MNTALPNWKGGIFVCVVVGSMWSLLNCCVERNFNAVVYLS